MEPEEIKAGRRLVLGVIVAILALSVLAIVASNLIVGPERLPRQIVRFLLEVALCIFLYRGANWARWVVSILFGLAGVGSLIWAASTLSTSIAAVPILVMGLVYVASAVILLFVPSVRAYFDARGLGQANN